MTDAISQFLNGTQWAMWERTLLAGDASSRRYERLTDKNGQSVILMDSSYNPKAAMKFAKIADHLVQYRLCPPRILEHDRMNGLMLLSDLGSVDFASHLARYPGAEAEAYQVVLDILATLHDQTELPELDVLTADVSGQMVAITCEYYANNPSDKEICKVVTQSFAELTGDANHLALRDFHAENLIWRKGEFGNGRVGLLDFQDAFIAPAGYDLMSLLRDARRDVSRSLIVNMMDRFLAKTNMDRTDGYAQLACLSAQRNLRILGVFARLAKEEGKKHYLDLIPRVWKNLMLDLAHPKLCELKQAVHDTLPEPNDTLAKRLNEV